MLFRLPSEEELTDNKLNEFIAKHNAECAFRFKHLKDAYETDYQIFHQKPKPDYKPDNRIAVNFAKYMVDTFNGYFIGNPIRISVDNDTNDNIKKYVELLDQYNDQDDNNAELSKICCIYGKGYEMYYVDELGNIGITYLTPFDAFMIYDDSVLCREQYFVRLYIDSNDVLHGSVSDAEKIRWFTQKGKLVWEEEKKIHGFDGVPATEYAENKERTCIFEPVMSMIDAYNKAISEKSNDVDYFADAYMKIHEYGHYIADSLNKNFSVEDYDIVQSSLLRYFDGDIFKAKTSNLVDVLGSYGSKDAREAFAEAFAEAYTCKNPRKFAKIFKEELEKTLKRSSSTGRHQSSIAKGKGNDIINSGAVKGALTDKNDPLYVKRDAHAIKYYESVRRSKKNNMVKTIANNTGISEKSINKVYDHVFIKEHELYGGKRRFDPDYDMAESFRRLREGKNIQEHDLIMLKHERLEYELMNKKHMSYQEAHRLAEKKYNYQKALKEFKNKNNL